MIIWLEDREATVREEIAVLSENDIDYVMHQTLKSFDNFLREQSKLDPFPVRGFIIDIMLHGVKNLSEFGINHAPTLEGNHTGFVFVDRYLRTPRSGDPDWSGVPVCFLTERFIDSNLEGDLEYLAERNQGAIDICRKYSQADTDRFLKIVSSWGRQNE